MVEFESGKKPLKEISQQALRHALAPASMRWPIAKWAAEAAGLGIR
jgi:hypothetical protein